MEKMNNANVNEKTVGMENMPFYQVSLDQRGDKLHSTLKFAKDIDELLSKTDITEAQKIAKEATEKILVIVQVAIAREEEKQKQKEQKEQGGKK